MGLTREELDHAARLLRRLAGMAQVAVAELALLAGRMGASAASDPHPASGDAGEEVRR